MCLYDCVLKLLSITNKNSYKEYFIDVSVDTFVVWNTKRNATYYIISTEPPPPCLSPSNDLEINFGLLIGDWHHCTGFKYHSVFLSAVLITVPRANLLLYCNVFLLQSEKQKDNHRCS